MNLEIGRLVKASYGIFSRIQDEQKVIRWYGVEHAYQNASGLWLPKIPNGVYDCVLGTHTLPWHQLQIDPLLADLGAKLIPGNLIQFQTYEITGVIGHTNLLFHWGNFNSSSEGCCCIGKTFAVNMVTDSRAAFVDFFKAQNGISKFSATFTD